MSEALNIHPTDIDGKRLLLKVRFGKGGKSRAVPIREELLERLRTFYRSHRNPNWLFPGPGRGWKSSGVSLKDALHASDHAMTKSSVWTVFKIAKASSGLQKRHRDLRIHTLRHSYATHLLEGGASVRQVAAYLGHTTLKPTMIYLHLTEVSEAKAREALRTLPGV